MIVACLAGWVQIVLVAVTVTALAACWWLRERTRDDLERMLELAAESSALADRARHALRGPRRYEPPVP